MCPVGVIYVTLRVRVWIEIFIVMYNGAGSVVTLRVRVWIEIISLIKIAALSAGHPPCEGVD